MEARPHHKRNSTRNRPPIASMALYVIKIKQIVIYADTIIVMIQIVDNQVQLQKQQIIYNKNYTITIKYIDTIIK